MKKHCLFIQVIHQWATKELSGGKNTAISE